MSKFEIKSEMNWFHEKNVKIHSFFFHWLLPVLEQTHEEDVMVMMIMMLMVIINLLQTLKRLTGKKIEKD